MKKIVTLCSAIVVLLVFHSCQKDEFLEESYVEIENNESKFSEGQMILGKQLENPYSVENMQKAFYNLQGSGQLKSATINTTHLYVRFRPKDWKEYNIITRDTTLEFYDYPLDVEIKKGGTYYHDPSIPLDEITWQYTVVPVDYKFRGNVKYEKLAKLYLPYDGGELEKLKSADISNADWLKLETEALKITNNLDETTLSENTLKSTNWRPAGTIRVYDDIIDSYSSTIKVFDYWEYYDCPYSDPENPDGGSEQEPDGIPEDPDICKRAVYHYETSTTNSHYVPLVGVEVRARRWFTTHTGYTDANGDFSCDGTFTRDANYSIKWERYDFDIRDGSYGQAYYNGPDQTGDWNLNIEQASTPKSFLFAHIFRAAYVYYYNHNQWGIKAPPERDGVFSFLGQRLHIAGKDKSGTSKYLDIRQLWQSAEISVFSKTSLGAQKDSRKIFGTTIHELAHASHWEIGYSSVQYAIDWVFDSPYLPESWAVGVETILTRDVYDSDDYNNHYQSQTISDMSDGYTCIVEDLIDNVNQKGNDPNYPNDEVSGYTLSQIEDALPNNLGSWWVWRTNLKDMYTNTTEGHLDALFQSIKQ